MTNILDGASLAETFATSNHITPRTLARYRKAGLPWFMWGGKIFIPVEKARQWLDERTVHANQRKRAGGGR